MIILKIEDIQAWLAQKALWDSQSIEDIEFTLNGEPYKPQLFWTDAKGKPTSPIGVDDFKFMGIATHGIFEVIVEDLAINPTPITPQQVAIIDDDGEHD